MSLFVRGLYRTGYHTSGGLAPLGLRTLTGTRHIAQGQRWIHCVQAGTKQVPWPGRSIVGQSLKRTTPCQSTLEQISPMLPMIPLVLTRASVRWGSTKPSVKVPVAPANVAPEKPKTAESQEPKSTQATSGTTSGSSEVTPKPPLMTRIKEEVLHYWHGTKLLAKEVSISSKLLWRMLKGEHLTRREQRQLRRTAGDLFRLVPFSVFIIVPFMELLLPVALKLFPSMLPSTFESKAEKEEKRRKLLKVRVEMARFLRETIDEGVMATRGKDSINTTEFIDFFINLRSSDKPVNIDKLLAIAKKFEDELTLDNLSRPQLLSMCRYMNINTFGTDNFLRYKLRNRMWQIKADDRLIAAEGVEELTPTELAHACTSRGLRTVGVSEEEQRAALRLWLNLHLEQKLPTTLLVLTYAFALLARTKSAPEALQATLSSLPDKLVNEAHLKVSEEAGVATPKQRLDVIKEQEELIEDERERSRLEEEAAVRIAEGASASDEVTADETTTASTADIPEGKVLVNQDEAHPTLTASPSMTDDKDTLHAKETKLHA